MGEYRIIIMPDGTYRLVVMDTHRNIIRDIYEHTNMRRLKALVMRSLSNFDKLAWRCALKSKIDNRVVTG
jgi:hypothetical protein